MNKYKRIVLKNNLLEKALMGVAVTIPFWLFLNNIAIVITLIVSLFLYSKKRNFDIKNNIVGILYCLLYLIMVVSFFYSDDKEYGFKVLNRSIFLILFPIIFWIAKFYIKREVIYKILQAFIMACFAACILCLIAALYHTWEYAAVNPFNSSNGNFFSYFNLTAILKAHPIYFGTYIVFSISILMFDLFLPVSRFSLGKIFKLLLIAFFILFTFLLNSFLLICVLTFIILALLFYFFKDKNTGISKRVVVLFFFLMSIPVYFSSNFIIEKFKGVNIIDDLTTRDYSGDDFTAIKARNAKAYCSIDLIKDNFLFGVGVGDGNKELLKYYLKNNFIHGYKREFNSHNQFLTTFIYTGVFGFLLLLVIIVSLFYKAIKYKNFYLLSFIIICSCFFITESVLERQSGVVFFLFFSGLVSLRNENNSIFTK